MLSRHWPIEEAAQAYGWEYMSGGWEDNPYDPERDQYERAGIDTEYAGEDAWEDFMRWVDEADAEEMDAEWPYNNPADDLPI